MVHGTLKRARAGRDTISSLHSDIYYIHSMSIFTSFAELEIPFVGCFVECHSVPDNTLFELIVNSECY